ncbi:vWA domain-containing protein [Cellulosilyticum sp. I15G10I2]|uniref:vWA domain-containing protein n=1 Tax=Cellulosilyticum sp. I15G10I2 TaxID=1892843 RepID=UPI00085C7FF5|nr:VWA-like domain-containing protein [Cellulosilyticum sp. I15G10I2]
MENYFDKQARALYEKANKMINTVSMLKTNRAGEKIEIESPQDFKSEFFGLVDKVNLSLMEEKDNFYGYFLFQMSREIRFDIASPSAVNFKGAKYVIYFNPILFLTLNIKQMASTIKHEIHHILSLHLIRAKALKGRYSTLAINMAMDIVVNGYLNHLPPYATTLERVNIKYALKLEPYETFEYYVEKIQTELDLMEEDETGEEDDSDQNTTIETEYSQERTHDIWEYADEVDEKTIKEFTEKFFDNAQRGKIPAHLEGMIASLKKNKGELPWHLYLDRLMGILESNKKKTTTRRSRRQPDRLDLRGELRHHKAEIAVALDISGSMSDEEFKQAMKEVLNIVKNYNHKITIIECDNQIRRVYLVKSIKDLKDRMRIRGGTKFTPVFEYVNQHKNNLLVYFTDGKGEDKLQIKPRGYKVLWVISGRGDKLSLKEPYGIVKKLSKVELKDSRPDMSDVRNDGYSAQNQEPSH